MCDLGDPLAAVVPALPQEEDGAPPSSVSNQTLGDLKGKILL